MTLLLDGIKNKSLLAGCGQVEGISSFASSAPGQALDTQSLLKDGMKFVDSSMNITMQPARSFCQLGAVFAGCVATVEAVAKAVIAARLGAKREATTRSLEGLSSATGVVSKVASITQGSMGVASAVMERFTKSSSLSTSLAAAVSARALAVLSPLGGVLSLAKNSLSLFYARRFASSWKNVCPVEGSCEDKVQRKIKHLLQKSLEVNPERIFAALRQKHGDKLANYLEGKGDQFLKRFMRKMLRDSPLQDKHLLHNEVKTLLAKGDMAKVLQEDLGIRDSTLPTMALLGLAVEVEKKRLDKQFKLFSFLSTETKTQVKDALDGSLLERLGSCHGPTQRAAFAEAKALVDQVEKDLQGRGRLLLRKIGMGLITLVTSAMAIIFTAGSGALAAAIMSFSSSILSYKLDIDELREALKTKMTPEKRDVWFSRVFVVLAVLATAASVAAVGVLSMGAVPALLTIIGAIAALGFACVNNNKIERAALSSERLSASFILQRIERRFPYAGFDDAIAPQFVYRLLQRMQEKDLSLFKAALAEGRGFKDASQRLLAGEDASFAGRELELGPELYRQGKGDEQIKSICLELYKESGQIAYRHLYDSLQEEVEDRLMLLDATLNLEQKQKLFSIFLKKRIKKAEDFVFDQSNFTMQEVVQALKVATASL